MGAPERNIDIIPGTEVLFKHDAGSDAGSDHLVLIPRPTARADDPLNWTPTWKTIVIVNQSIFVFVSIMTPLAIAPMTEIFMAEFHKTLPQVNMLFGAAAITLGYANFLIVPAANVFGRRPVVIVCGLVCVLANVWQALVTSFPSFLGARVISGVGAAANESIMPMVVADVLFLHQRGRSMALYFWAYFLGLFIGPIISGSIAAQLNWRWFFWVCTILQAASLLLIIVAFPETKYDRPSGQGADEEVIAGTVTTTVDAEKSAANADVAVVTEDVESRLSPAAAAAGGGPQKQSEEQAASSTYSSSPAGAAAAAANSADAANLLLGRGRPTRWQFSPLPFVTLRRDRRRASAAGRAALATTVVRDVVSPLQILAYPIVLWAALAMGFAANSLLALNLTQAQVFAAPPYFFTPAPIGYVNFAFAAGAVLALLTAGPLSDWVALRAARRNGGILEAEMRLPALVPFIAANLVGMVVTAVGYQRSWDWPVIVVVGYGLVGVQVVGIPAIVIAYAVDCYKHLPGEIMIAATIVKNTFGFGMIFYYNDWAAMQGYLGPVLTLMALTVGFSLLGLALFIPFGKTFRRYTKDSKLHEL